MNSETKLEARILQLDEKNRQKCRLSEKFIELGRCHRILNENLERSATDDKLRIRLLEMHGNAVILI